MTKRSLQLLLLAGVNGLLLLLLVAGLVTSPKRASRRQAAMNLLTDSAKVASIRIEAQEVLELVRKGDVWTVLRDGQAFPADNSRITAFLTAVAGIKSGEKIASKPESRPSLGLEGEQSARLILLDMDGKNIMDIIVGNYATGSNAVYALKADSADIWKLDAGFASYLKGAAALWFDLRLFPGIAVKDIQSFSIRGQLQGADGARQAIDYALSRNNSTWVVAGNAEALADTQKVEALLRTWTSARAERFLVPSDAESGLPVGGLRLELVLGSGTAMALTVNPEAVDNGHSANLEYSDRKVRISAWALRECVRPLQELLAGS